MRIGARVERRCIVRCASRVSALVAAPAQHAGAIHQNKTAPLGSMLEDEPDRETPLSFDARPSLAAHRLHSVRECDAI